MVITCLCPFLFQAHFRYDFAAKTKIPLGDAIRDKLAAYEAACEGEFPVLPDQPAAPHETIQQSTNRK